MEGRCLWRAVEARGEVAAPLQPVRAVSAVRRPHPRLRAPWPDEALQLDRCVQPPKAAAQDAHAGAAALARAGNASAGCSGASG